MTVLGRPPTGGPSGIMTACLYPKFRVKEVKKELTEIHVQTWKDSEVKECTFHHYHCGWSVLTPPNLLKSGYGSSRRYRPLQKPTV